MVAYVRTRDWFDNADMICEISEMHKIKIKRILTLRGNNTAALIRLKDDESSRRSIKAGGRKSMSRAAADLGYNKDLAYLFIFSKIATPFYKAPSTALPHKPH